ncbi:MAG: Uma2 family endonuclease [Methylococcales bacterium]|nr:Uma2 family endonuclease [Methylococcales bacterium]
MQWQDVLADKSLRDLPYKIELNERGNIEMSPASFLHSLLEGEIATLLRTQLGGRVFTELAIQTGKGVRVPDVAWGSNHFVEQHIKEICASAAPEICIEIISPSNSMIEMSEKIALFLESGAIEVWLVDEQGNISFFNAGGQLQESSFNIEMGKLI